MTDYQSELQIVQEKVMRKSKVESMLKSLESQLEDLQTEEQRLGEIREQEQMELDRLEKGGLAAFFYSLSGSREERIEEGKLEAYAALVKHESAVKQIEEIQREKETLKAELVGLLGIEEKFDGLIAERRTQIIREDPEGAEEILAIERQAGLAVAMEGEIEEAIAAGGQVLEQINRIEEELSSAAGWGTWDLLGGGLITTFAKHSHLDDAQAQVDDLQELLRQYHLELTDVSLDGEIQVQIDGFLRFADYFFDGLIADWAVLGRIHQSQEEIQSLRLKVDQIQGQLESRRLEAVEEVEELRIRREEMIMEIRPL